MFWQSFRRLVVIAILGAGIICPSTCAIADPGDNADAIVEVVTPANGANFYNCGDLFSVPVSAEGVKVSFQSGVLAVVSVSVLYAMELVVNGTNIVDLDNAGPINVQTNMDGYWSRSAKTTGTLSGYVFPGPGQHTVKGKSEIAANRLPAGPDRTDFQQIDNTFTLHSLP